MATEVAPSVSPPAFTANEHFPQPPPEVFDAWRIHHDAEAGATILTTYGAFVVSIVTKYSGSLRHNRGIVDENDLRQAGVQSVFGHAETFDPHAGIRFLSYSSKGVRGDTLTAFTEHAGALTLPDQARDFHTKILREERRRAFGGEPPLTDHEMHELLKIPETGRAILPRMGLATNVHCMRHALALWGAVSLEAVCETEGLDIVANARVIAPDLNEPPHPEEAALEAERHALVRKLMDVAFMPNPEDSPRLKQALPRYKDTMSLLCGFGEDGRHHTRAEIAEIMGRDVYNINRMVGGARRRLREVIAADPQFADLIPAGYFVQTAPHDAELTEGQEPLPTETPMA